MLRAITSPWRSDDPRQSDVVNILVRRFGSYLEAEVYETEVYVYDNGAEVEMIAAGQCWPGYSWVHGL